VPKGFSIITRDFSASSTLPASLRFVTASAYLSEEEAREVLLEKFTQKGLNITEDFQFSLDTVTFNADGFDTQKKVGYEYLYFYDFQNENQMKPDSRT
jgi:hypothetical protein